MKDQDKAKDQLIKELAELRQQITELEASKNNRNWSEKKPQWNEAALLRSMTNSSPLAFLVVDNRTDAVLYFNDCFCEIWGIEHLKEQMQYGEMKNNDIIPHCLSLLKDVPSFVNLYKPLQSEENRTVVENEIPLVDGRTIRLFSTQIRDDYDRYFGRLYIFEDITKRKREEDALRASLNKYKELVDLLPITVFEIDQRGYLTFANPNGFKSFGYTKNDFEKGIYSLQLIINDDRDRANQNIRRVFSGENISGTEYTAQRKDGSTFPIVIHFSPIINENEPVGLRGIIVDITKRKLAEEKLRESEDKYRTIFETTGTATAIIEEDTTISLANTEFDSLSGYSREAVEGKKSMTEFIVKDDLERIKEYHHKRRINPDAVPKNYEFRFIDKQGNVRDVYATVNMIPGSKKSVLSLLNITERKRVGDHIRREVARVEVLAEVSQALAETSLDYKAALETIVRRTVELIGGACVIRLLSDDGQWLYPVAIHHQNPEAISLLYNLLAAAPLRVGERIAGRVVETGQPMLLPVVSPDQARALTKPEYWSYLDRFGIYSFLSVPLRIQGRVIGSMCLLGDCPGDPYSNEDQVFLQNLADRVASAIANTRLLNDNLRQLKTLSGLITSAQKLVQSIDLQELSEDITRTCVEFFGPSLAWLGRAEEGGRVRLLTYFPPQSNYPVNITTRWDDSVLGQGPMGCAIRNGSPVVITDIASDPNFLPWREAALNEGFCCVAAFPLINRDMPFGGLVLYSEQPGYFTPKRVEFFQTYAHQAAAALENARLFKETQLRSEHLQALRNIDMAITGSLDLRVTLNIVLEQVIAQLGIDAADILLLNPYMQTLEYAAGRGFRSKGIEHSRQRMGEGNAGRAALKRRIVHITNLPEAGEAFTRTHLVVGEDFIAYYGVPLIAKGQIKGVLEIFHRAPLDPDPEWLDFLEALALQAAIAIDNAFLFNDLQRSNTELTLAYDATIEGWSRALDLRDKETEGHSQRVTENTLHLARAMGISEAELVHVRRGALLHDIGKMGIPDNILLKPGPLTNEEWEIMRRHPGYAYEMLLPIDYLRPALDIPYCHHEKWDGTGYPRGLKGEQIPLAARIFAVVDIWDALHSDRPYRSGWPNDKVREYIREQAGKHFDPKVVEVFLKMEIQ